MKAPLIWPFLICFICSCFFSEAQTYNSSCIPASPVMESTYRNDACRIAIKRMHEIVSPFIDSVAIPEMLIDSIVKALYAVDNIQDALVDDTLRGIFGHVNFIPGSDSTHIISASNDLNDAFGLKQIRVIVDNNIAWATQWLSGNYNATSNDSVNYLINNHHLQVIQDQYQLYTTKTVYIISSPLAINAGALASKFEKFSGVGNGNAYALNALPSGSGNIIHATFVGNDIELYYSFGCGDCPSGCTIGRSWNFKIHTGTGCSVDYLSVANWGSPMLWQSIPCLDYTQPITLCPSFGSAILYSNLNGSNTYQWQVSIDGVSFNNISDDSNYTGTSTATLNLNTIPSSWYGKIYTCLSNNNRGKVYFTLKFVNTWNSTSDSAWENIANWTCGSLPDSNTDVVIKTGSVFLNSDAIVRTLTVATGATFNIAPGKHLTILH